MIKAAAMNGWLDEKQVVLESIAGRFKRAGSDAILTYYATVCCSMSRINAYKLAAFVTMIAT